MSGVTQVLYGDRISKQGKLRPGCCAVIFDQRRRVLLTKRADNGLWCLPGGSMEPGESAEECCSREIREETGLKIHPTRLIGVYSNRDQLVMYGDGSKVQFVILSFEGEIAGGKLGLSDETTDAGFYSLAEMESMPMHAQHKQRVEDALQDRVAAIIR
jgi:ADP-ribose pyrophosphatase YjhB (NUDIX family)